MSWQTYTESKLTLPQLSYFYRLIMLVRKKQHIDKLCESLEAHYPENATLREIDIEKSKLKVQEQGDFTLWSVPSLAGQIQTEILLQGKTAIDFYCTCDRYEVKHHCTHLSDLAKLISKKHQSKLTKVIPGNSKKTIYQQLNEQLQLVNTAWLAKAVLQVSKLQQDIALLFITATHSVSDFGGFEQHLKFITEHAGYKTHPRKSSKKLEDHMALLKNRIENLYGQGELAEAIALYCLAAKYFFSIALQGATIDKKWIPHVHWMEETPSRLFHPNLSPKLVSQLGEAIRHIFLQTPYPTQYCSRSLFYLSQLLLPARRELSDHYIYGAQKCPRYLEVPEITLQIESLEYLNNVVKGLKIDLLQWKKCWEWCLKNANKQDYLPNLLFLLQAIQPIEAKAEAWTIILQSLEWNESIGIQLAKDFTYLQSTEILHLIPKEVLAEWHFILLKENQHIGQFDSLITSLEHFRYTLDGSSLNWEDFNELIHLIPYIEPDRNPAHQEKILALSINYLTTYFGEQNRHQFSKLLEGLKRQNQHNTLALTVHMLKEQFPERSELQRNIVSLSHMEDPLVKNH